ncbi:hypothetical protein [uncultured Winogradskyella sp.]|uniref:hypothetical protein n=1 Tax=uncultured Winogradskyella sp. TaxID=395353 RepID=UPI00262D06C0|nr:hypothetical protein [uncultured Winogradskyella sp.]
MSRATTYFLRLIFTLLFATSLSAQQIIDNVTKPSLSKHSLAEKIYLQIDNTIYKTGEKVWFKAIVSKSYDNSLSDISGILHVELIDSNKIIVDSKLLKLKDGIASSNFDLEKSFTSGKYLIRAYTRWNRNFDDDFIFTQSIDVINLKKKVEQKTPIINITVGTGDFKTLSADINPKIIDSKFKGKLKLYIDTGSVIDSIELKKDNDNIYKLDYELPKDATQAELKFKFNSDKNSFIEKEDNVYSKTIIIDKNYLDVQFFPEGGNLVDNLLSTVGFKAIDYNGMGKKVKGKIIDNLGNEVTTFNSNDLGMGTFKLLPQKEANYFAKITIEDVVYKFNLPLAKNKGSVLSAVNLKDEIKLLITSNSKSSDNFIIQTQAKGVKYHSLPFSYKDTINVSIPRLTLPDGIVKLSVVNDNKQIVCERLFFNNREDYRLNIELTSDKTSYMQRDKVGLSLKLDSLQKPTQPNLSVLVLDKERAESSKGFRPHILSYLLLNSELKGFVENPMYYFDKQNKDRGLDIDALMLTQGWRAYKYQKTTPNTTYAYQPEKNLTVSGTVGEYFNPNKKPKNPLDINLFVYGEPMNTYTQEITPQGKYYFELEDVYKSSAELFMQVVDKKGTPIDFNINVDKKWSPKVQIHKEQTVDLPSYIKSNFVLSAENENKIQQQYETAFNTVALDEVNIKGYKLTPAREEFIALHGEPDIVIEGKELNEKAPDWNYGLFSVLQSQFRDEVDVISVGPPVGRQWLLAKVKNYDFTYILVDNIPIFIGNYPDLQDFPVEEVESMDILRKPKDKNRYCAAAFPGARGCPKRVALINIYTYSKKGFFGITKAKGTLTSNMRGFSESIEFYAPNYDTLTNQDWVIPDNRSVIHWSPDIMLDANGEYTLEFYNDDHIGEVSVIVEAISKDGRLCYLEKTYNIKEAQR